MINEDEFEDVFQNFKDNKVTGQFGEVYEKVLETVGTAHEKNKRVRLAQEEELAKIRLESAKITKETNDLMLEKEKCLGELKRRKQ